MLLAPKYHEYLRESVKKQVILKYSTAMKESSEIDPINKRVALKATRCLFKSYDIHYTFSFMDDTSILSSQQ